MKNIKNQPIDTVIACGFYNEKGQLPILETSGE